MRTSSRPARASSTRLGIEAPLVERAQVRVGFLERLRAVASSGSTSTRLRCPSSVASSSTRLLRRRRAARRARRGALELLDLRRAVRGPQHRLQARALRLVIAASLRTRRVGLRLRALERQLRAQLFALRLQLDAAVLEFRHRVDGLPEPARAPRAWRRHWPVRVQLFDLGAPMRARALHALVARCSARARPRAGRAGRMRRAAPWTALCWRRRRLALVAAQLGSGARRARRCALLRLVRRRALRRARRILLALDDACVASLSRLTRSQSRPIQTPSRVITDSPASSVRRRPAPRPASPTR